jgi:hypothetical protein
MRQLLALLLLAITVYGIVDCAQADARTRRGLPLWLWVLIMLLLPGIGTLIWLLVSRLGPADTAPRRTVVAPDDDPEFLRDLERRRRAQEKRRGASDDEDAPGRSG